MSIAAFAVTEAPIAAQSHQTRQSKPPPKRTLAAKADQTSVPEAR